VALYGPKASNAHVSNVRERHFTGLAGEDKFVCGRQDSAAYRNIKDAASSPIRSEKDSRVILQFNGMSRLVAGVHHFVRSCSFLTSIFVVVMLFVTSVGLGQSTQDPRTLLHQVAEASRNLKTYRAEGHLAQDLDMGIAGGKENFAFHVVTRLPSQMRIEISGGRSFEDGLPFLAICDGKTGWVYYSKRNVYRKIEADSDLQGYCAPSLLSTFSQVDENLKTAVISGNDRSNFEGRSQSCVVVQAKYRAIDRFLITPGLVARVGRVSRTMCIEPTRKLILRDRLEADLEAGTDGGHVDETIAYDRIERDPEISASLFDFNPPTGAKLFQLPAAPAAKATPEPEPAPSHLSRVMARPEAIFETQPEYSQEAWDEGIQGKVILTARVETDGSIHDFKIEQSLGYGLDEKAIECVRKWRFKPATDDGKPVPGNAYVTMDFVLPDKRPAQPSSFTVSRPAPVPILSQDKFHLRGDRDEFFYAVAHALRAPDLCQRIDPMTEESSGNNWGGPRGMEITMLRSNCYYDLAVGLADVRLCDKVRPVRVNGYDGREFNPTYCRNQIPAGRTPREGPILPPETGIPDENLEGFVHIMQRLGFDDHVSDYVYKRNPRESPVTTAYERLKNDPEFLRRAQAGPSHEEPESPAKVRSGNALEYLYYLLAIDNGAPALCAKISPNATFGTKGLLRAACYRRIAVKRRDANLCMQMPSFGAFPAASRYYSREECDKSIHSGHDLLHRSDVVDYPPSEFPQREFLRDALRALAEVRHETAEESAKSFRISSGNRRVCTTFLVGSEVFGKSDTEQVE
jgi:TonB family protein